MNTLIKNGLLVTSAGSYQGDILIENGRIAEIGKSLSPVGAEVYDAAGCEVYAGFIDAHTHLDMNTGTAQTADDFNSGTKAALAGGTTTILDFATQNKGENLSQALENWHKKARGNAYCDYGFHMAITDWNEGVKAELPRLIEAGVTSFKVYLAYDNLRLRDGELYEILKYVGIYGGIVGAHCENGDLVNVLTKEYQAKGCFSPRYHPLSRPDYVEAEAVARYCYIANAANVPVHIVHLSTKAGLEEVRRARQRGQQVYAETCPHYLVLEDSVYDLPDFAGAKYVCSPPIRGCSDQAALWEALGTGELNTVSTDHCSFNFKGQKEQGKTDFSNIPNGLPGIEHRPALLYTYGVQNGKITREQIAALLSENTAKLFGLYPQKGTLSVGSDGDIVIWNPKQSGIIIAKAMLQNVDYTPFEGMETIGTAQAVFLRGALAAEHGKVLGERTGEYIPRGKSIFF